VLSFVLFSGTIPKGITAELATVAPRPPQPLSNATPEYRMGPEDLLRVSVWENRDLTLDLVVRPDGKISMPLIQDVMAAGRTASSWRRRSNRSSPPSSRNRRFR